MSNQILRLSLLLSLSACTPDAPFCETREEQDFNECAACGAEPGAALPSEQNDEWVSFGHCIQDADENLCAAANPKGAEEWAARRDRVCDACASECCYFCGSPYGRN